MATQLPVKTDKQGVTAKGCCTPLADTTPQKMSITPKRVLPIIFLPGIMGSNLRMSAERQAFVKASNNIAWRPDHVKEGAALLAASSADRQRQLDPDTTEVDIYDPDAPTGDKTSARERHTVTGINVHLGVGVNTPLLTDDPPGVSNRVTKEMRARGRGWSEIYFSSYRVLLEQCEMLLNSIAPYGPWGKIYDVEPARWLASSSSNLKPFSFQELKEATGGCWYPVHAMGYNWLRSNEESGIQIAKRIRELIAKYCAEKYECEKVIIVTHSMGGLVARAVIHPQMGALESEVLGIVHGAMPAIGAPAAYKRMRCGFEEGSLGLSIPPKVLGNYGDEVTAVLGNSRGGLELLPSRAYGNDWLTVRQDGNLLISLPKNNDPYSEIYKIRGKWYSLFREEWINPANLPERGFEQTCKLLNRVQNFHDNLNATYHPTSYAHYSADLKKPSWERISWILDKKYKNGDWQSLLICKDNKQGKFEICSNQSSKDAPVFSVTLGESVGPGDKTVPLQSADHQLKSGKFTGIFRQEGYEHQDSYKDSSALNSTLYSLVRIIQSMRWSKNAKN